MRRGKETTENKIKRKGKEVKGTQESCEAVHSVNYYLLWLAGRDNQLSAARFYFHRFYFHFKATIFIFLCGDSICLCKRCHGTKSEMPTSNLGVK